MLRCAAQDAERAELERISQQLAEEREEAEAALASAAAMREQQAAAAAELARREAALEARQGQLAGLQAQLVAAQGAALQQLEVLEGAVRARLEGHQKQVRAGASHETCMLDAAGLCIPCMCVLTRSSSSLTDLMQHSPFCRPIMIASCVFSNTTCCGFSLIVVVVSGV